MAKEFKTCLLIEDDPDDQEFFMNTLHNVSSDTGCYAVSNGEEALTTLWEERIMPDYIFTDIQMPRMNGYEFLKKIKDIAKFKDIPVVVYSSHHSEDMFQKMKMLGVVEFYSKTRFTTLPDILRKYFGAKKSDRRTAA